MKKVRLKDVAQVIMGQSPPGNSYNDNRDGLPLLNGAADYDGQIFTPKKYTTKPTKIAQEGDLLMGVRATIGNFAISDKEYCIGRGVVAIRVDEQFANKKYVLKVIEQNLNDFLNISAGSTIKGIKKEDLTELVFPLPPLGIQNEIVGILDGANTLLQKRKQVMNLLDIYIKSVFIEMFGDTATNPKGWTKAELKSFGDIITGNTPSRDEKENYSSSYIEWIKTDNIVEDKLYLTKASEYLSESGFKKARFVTSGAVLMACIAGSIASIGRVAIADRKVSFNQQINTIQPNEKVNSLFLYWLLKNSRTYIQDHATRGMKRILTKGEFEKIEMIVPPINLQEKFAKIAQDTETLKQKMLEQSMEMENQFQALMQKSFSQN